MLHISFHTACRCSVLFYELGEPSCWFYLDVCKTGLNFEVPLLCDGVQLLLVPLLLLILDFSWWCNSTLTSQLFTSDPLVRACSTHNHCFLWFSIMKLLKCWCVNRRKRTFQLKKRWLISRLLFGRYSHFCWKSVPFIAEWQLISNRLWLMTRGQMHKTYTTNQYLDVVTLNSH